MKYLLPFFIVFTIAVRPVLPLVNYVVNYDFIVKNICENHGKPQLNCNGKCYLAKELTKTEKNSTKDLIKNNSIDVFLAKEILTFTKIEMTDPEVLKKSSTDHHLYYSDHLFSIFHPPLI